MLAGWVALAPVGVKDWGGPWEYTHKQVKLLAMYGSEDPMKEDASLLTKLFQTASVVRTWLCCLDSPCCVVAGPATHSTAAQNRRSCQCSGITFACGGCGMHAGDVSRRRACLLHG